MKGRTGLWLAGAFAVLALLAALLGDDGGDQGQPSREEKRMAQVLSAIEGAGDVEVALFYSTESQRAFASGARASKPTGAVVVAQGAEDVAVRLKLIRAARTLLGLPENAVDVFVMEEGR